MPIAASPLLQPCASLRRYAGEYASHAHDYAQVLVGLAGHLELEIDGRCTYVDAACGLIVPAGVSHASLAQSPAQVLVIDSPVGRGLERCRRFVPPAGWKHVGDAFDAMGALRSAIDASTLLPRRPIDLAKLDAALDAELHAAWTTPRLAALCGLSAQRFHARFQELTGLAPAAYVRARRLDRAERLLKAGLSLDAAALQVGYSSASALAFALRRERGVGARALRRRR